MLIDDFTHQLEILNQTGMEFARAHPEFAKSLHLTDPNQKDPKIERLLEGVAFLCAWQENQRKQQEREFYFSLINNYFFEFISNKPSDVIAQIETKKNIAKHTEFKTEDNSPIMFTNPEEFYFCDNKIIDIILDANLEIKLKNNNKIKIYLNFPDVIQKQWFYIFCHKLDFNKIDFKIKFKTNFLEIDNIKNNTIKFYFKPNIQFPSNINKKNLLLNCIELKNIFKNHIEPIEIKNNKKIKINCDYLDSRKKIYKIFNKNIKLIEHDWIDASDYENNVLSLDVLAHQENSPNLLQAGDTLVSEFGEGVLLFRPSRFKKNSNNPKAIWQDFANCIPRPTNYLKESNLKKILNYFDSNFKILSSNYDLKNKFYNGILKKYIKLKIYFDKSTNLGELNILGFKLYDFLSNNLFFEYKIKMIFIVDDKELVYEVISE